MHHRRYVLSAAFFAAVAALVAAPSTLRAETPAQILNGTPLDQALVKQVIDGIATELRESYVFPELGKQAANAIQDDLEAYAYSRETDPVELALQITERLRTLTNDSHVRVIHGDPFANRPEPSTPQGAGLDVKRLDGNVGYIHIGSFAPPEDFKSAADEAMRELADTVALIIDMRDNGGGHPASVAYLISFFLDPSQRLHINDLIWRNRGTTSFRTESFWSSSTPISYLGKPIYVLVWAGNLFGGRRVRLRHAGAEARNRRWSGHAWWRQPRRPERTRLRFLRCGADRQGGKPDHRPQLGRRRRAT